MTGNDHDHGHDHADAHDHAHGRDEKCGHGHDHGHGAGHHHHHPDPQDMTGRILLWTMLFNLAIPLAQVVGGWLAGSMALISDAIHNFSDFTGLLIAYAAFLISKRPPSVGFSFGYRRAEIVAAAANVILLFGACLFIMMEAFERLADPRPVEGSLVIILAAVGIVGNGVSAWFLHKGADHDLNVRGAFLHMVADMLVSVAVLGNGVVLLFLPWYWLDPMLSVVIVFFIVRGSWGVLREAVRILMEGVPEHLDLEAIRSRLEREPGVQGVHHLHAWNLGSNSLSFSCHVVVGDMALSRARPLATALRELLDKEFGIGHATFEFEAEECPGAPTLGKGV